MEKYMDILKKAAGSSAVMAAVRLGVAAVSIFSGIAVGKKVEQLTENKMAAVGAGIGTTVVIDAVGNKVAQPLYNRCAAKIFEAAEDVYEDCENYVGELTPEEQEEYNEAKENLNNLKEACEKFN